MPYYQQNNKWMETYTKINKVIGVTVICRFLQYLWLHNNSVKIRYTIKDINDSDIIKGKQDADCKTQYWHICTMIMKDLSIRIHLMI